MTRRGQCAGAFVYPEHHDAVAGLVCGEQQPAFGGNGEIAWCLALGRFVFNQRQLSALLVVAEHRDAVMSAVRAVNELAAGMHDDLRRGAIARETCRQRRHSLDFFQ